jgi:hypothetical protein
VIPEIEIGGANLKLERYRSPADRQVFEPSVDRPRGLTTVPRRTPAGVLHPDHRLAYAAALAAASIMRSLGDCGGDACSRLRRRDATGCTSPRTSRFGSPLVLSRVHWVRPEPVVEVKYLSWTDDNLLRQVIYKDCRRTNRRLRFAVLCRTRSPSLNRARLSL